MLFPYTEVLSAAPQVGFVFGFRALFGSGQHQEIFWMETRTVGGVLFFE